jgi:tetratricopeptide (TPR) repeat protein
VQRFQGQHEAALGSAQKAAAEAEAAWSARPGDAAVRSALAAASHQLAEVLADGRRYAEALTKTRRARELLEAALRENPLDAQHTRILLFVLNGESRYLWELGDRAGSLKVRARALEVAEEASRRDPRTAGARWAWWWRRSRWRKRCCRRGRRARACATSGGAGHRARGRGRGSAESLRAARRRRRRNTGSARAARGRLAPRIAEGCASLARVQEFWTGLKARAPCPPGETRISSSACPRCAPAAADVSRSGPGAG